MSPVPEAYRSDLPHPSEVVPKIVLLICAVLAFSHLFYRVTHPESVPDPVRVGLLHAGKKQEALAVLNAGLVLPSPLELARTPRSSRLSYPLGGEWGALTYNARAFGEVDHLGDDLNGIGGENSDLGDPIFAIGAGRVMYAAAASEGWGNVVLVQHRDNEGRFFQSFYGHLHSIHVGPGEEVHRGQILGTVGTAAGRYLAHLHFEIRESVALGPGLGYHPLRLDRRNPARFLRENRNALEEDLLPSLRNFAAPLKHERTVRMLGLREESPETR